MVVFLDQEVGEKLQALLHFCAHVSTSVWLQNTRLSMLQLPLTSLQCAFSFKRYCIFYLVVMRTDVLIRG